MSDTMARLFSALLPFVAFLYALAIFGFQYELFRDIYYGPAICLAAVILYLILPVGCLFECCVRRRAKTSEVLYRDYYFNFISDYDRMNPMTQKEAKVEFLKKLAEIGKIDQDEAHKKLQDINNSDKFSGLINYGQNAGGNNMARQQVDPLVSNMAPAPTDMPISDTAIAPAEAALAPVPALYSTPKQNQVAPGVYRQNSIDQKATLTNHESVEASAKRP